MDLRGLAGGTELGWETGISKGHTFCHPEGPQQELHEAQQEVPCKSCTWSLIPQYVLGATQLGSSSGEKGLGSCCTQGWTGVRGVHLQQRKFRISLAALAKCCLQIEGGALSLHSALVRPHLQACVQFWDIGIGQTRKNLRQFREGAQRGWRDWDIPHGQRARELGLFTRGDYWWASHQPNKPLRGGGCKEDRASLCAVTWQEAMVTALELLQQGEISHSMAVPWPCYSTSWTSLSSYWPISAACWGPSG